jgi:hypothetical protein
MNEKLERYRAAGQKAVEFQLQHQQPDGSYIWVSPDFSQEAKSEQKLALVRDAYHKQPYSWGVSGFYGAAHRLLNWIKNNTLQPEGGLKDYNGDVYKQSWFFQGVHRMGRFDISYPIMEFLLSCQAPCGGFPHFAQDELLRSLATAWMGVSALYFGRMDIAEKVADCCISMLEQQPQEDKFYYQMTRDGKLATPEINSSAGSVDFNHPGQCYWEIGLPWMLMGRMYQITRDNKYLDYANRFFQLKLNCYEDAFSCVGSGKSSLAAAIHYLNSGDTRARDAVYTFLDFLLETQYPEGGWRGENEPNTLLIYIDHAAEYNVWIQEDVSILAAMK